jgi:hypothetical protein
VFQSLLFTTQVTQIHVSPVKRNFVDRQLTIVEAVLCTIAQAGAGLIET